MFSSFSRTTDRSDRTVRPRRRSESVSAINRVKDSNRIPAVKIGSESDVATLVCLEVSRAMMMVPAMNMEVFLKSATHARRDIGMSDSTVLISVAILSHIGNEEMAEKLLSKSATLTKYYDRMGLKDKVTRGMLVTMLFALNPLFVDMLEKTVKITMDRSSSERRGPDTESEVSNALSLLTLEGTITAAECVKAMEDSPELAISLSPEARRFSIQKTPTEMIAPADSISVVNEKPRRRYRIDEKDLMEYKRRARAGNEPEFNEVFRSAPKPVVIEPRTKSDKTGIGYSAKADNNQNAYYKLAMDRILGSHTVKSVNMQTGEVTSRKPNVMDFIESEGISASVLEEAPDVASHIDENFKLGKVKKLLPTDFALPRSLYDSSEIKGKGAKRQDSFEELLRAEGMI